MLLQLGRVREAEPLLESISSPGRRRRPDARNTATWSPWRWSRRVRFSEAIAEMEAIEYKINKTLESQLNYLMGQAYEQNRDPARPWPPTGRPASCRGAGMPRGWRSPAWKARRTPDLAGRGPAARPVRLAGRPVAAGRPGAGAVAGPDAAAGGSDATGRPSRPSSTRQADGPRGRQPRAGAGRLPQRRGQARGRPGPAGRGLEAVARRRRDLAGRANLLYRRGQSDAALEVLDLRHRGGRRAHAVGHHALPADPPRAGSRPRSGPGRRPRPRPGRTSRPAIWKALGEYYRNQNDAANARRAFGEWSRLRPQPRAAPGAGGPRHRRGRREGDPRGGRGAQGPGRAQGPVLAGCPRQRAAPRPPRRHAQGGRAAQRRGGRQPHRGAEKPTPGPAHRIPARRASGRAAGRASTTRSGLHQGHRPPRRRDGHAGAGRAPDPRAPRRRAGQLRAKVGRSPPRSSGSPPSASAAGDPDRAEQMVEPGGPGRPRRASTLRPGRLASSTAGQARGGRGGRSARCWRSGPTTPPLGPAADGSGRPDEDDRRRRDGREDEGPGPHRPARVALGDVLPRPGRRAQADEPPTAMP